MLMPYEPGKDPWLDDAREHYFAAGGLESDLGPRDEPEWYWRRAAKLWRDKARELQRIKEINEQTIEELQGQAIVQDATIEDLSQERFSPGENDGE